MGRTEGGNKKKKETKQEKIIVPIYTNQDPIDSNLCASCRAYSPRS